MFRMITSRLLHLKIVTEKFFKRFQKVVAFSFFYFVGLFLFWNKGTKLKKHLKCRLSFENEIQLMYSHINNNHEKRSHTTFVLRTERCLKIAWFWWNEEGTFGCSIDCLRAHVRWDQLGSVWPKGYGRERGLRKTGRHLHFWWETP